MTAAVALLLAIGSVASAGKPNILLILCDDHRFDCLGSAGHPFLQTPHLDALAARGASLSRAYVTTSLCSPSRASILTGQYAHNHGVIDNYHPVDANLTFFPQRLQTAGYRTAMIGKWHMGGDDDSPQRGFDHWLSFKGQGTYFADGSGTTREVPQTTYDGYNLNGVRIEQEGYITDELTDYAVDWLDQQEAGQPWFMYLSHKAVHSDFVPAPRHRGRYGNQSLPIAIPTPEQLADGQLPMWVRNQRNSRHGVDFGYNLPDFDPTVYYQRYCEALLAVDESVGRLNDWLVQHDQLENTLIVYLGDNGFQFGDHGLIDKRTAYEASARIPWIVAGAGVATQTGGRTIDDLTGNIDMAATLLDAAAAEPLDQSDGESQWSRWTGQNQLPTDPERTLLYEYFWERNYPHTPTLHALLGGQYKYIRCHGLWDRDELYDLRSDPSELHNLINEPAQADRVAAMNAELWQRLGQSGGTSVRLFEDRGPTFPWRHPDQSPAAPQPREFFRTSEPDR